MLVGKYSNGPVKLFAGYEFIRYAPPSNPYAAGTGFTDIAGDFVCAGCAAINNTNINNTAFNAGDKLFNVFWTGVKYAVTDQSGCDRRLLSLRPAHLWRIRQLRRPPQRSQTATGRSTPFLSPSIGSLRRNSMPMPESCSRRSMAAWRTATSIGARSIPRLGFASASEKPTGGDELFISGLRLPKRQTKSSDWKNCCSAAVAASGASSRRISSPLVRRSSGTHNLLAPRQRSLFSRLHDDLDQARPPMLHRACELGRKFLN